LVRSVGISTEFTNEPHDGCGEEAAVDTLEQVAAEIRGCVRCRLQETRTQAVPGEGPADAALFLVGEAPGASEDLTGRPFQGASGRHLTAALAAAGMGRDEVFIGSANRCRPPGNRDPRSDEVAACADYLDRQLTLVAPRVVVAMGLTAARRLHPGARAVRRLGDLRGEVPDLPGDRPHALLITYHPAAAMRFPRLRQPFAMDIGRAVELARGYQTGALSEGSKRG
jgi:uracil-DNA glycosylase